MEGRPRGLPISFLSLDDVAIHVALGLLEPRRVWDRLADDVCVQDVLIQRLIRENVALSMIR